MDILTPAQRSHVMGLVRAKNTKPELAVRRLVHALGYRYRLHSGSLPGRPDMVFASRRKVIFVHGCFWHRHVGCAKATTPKANAAFWLAKFRANRKRDRLIERCLVAAGWRVVTVWECELKEPAKLKRRLIRELGSLG
jgi:DNA mismatch endonuclease (patch repair protein)